MGFGKSRQPGDLLIDLRIVLHGAGAERIEPRIDAEVSLRQSQKVAHHVELGEFWQVAVRGELGGWQGSFRYVGIWQVDAAASLHAQLIERRDDRGLRSDLVCSHRARTSFALCFHFAM